jgi:hypothetical protein
MFRVEFQECENTTALKIYGHLVDKYVEAARSLVARSQPKSRFVADLSDMTHVDEAGERFMQWLKRIGAQFVPGDPYSCGVCDRLHLPRAEGYASPQTIWTVRGTFASHG